MLFRWIIFLAFLLPFGSFGQQHSTKNKQQAAALSGSYARMAALISDTLANKEGAYLLQVKWRDSSFMLLRQHTGILNVPATRKDTYHYARYRSDSSWLATGMLPHANCHSFGLAQAFRQQGINPDAFFNRFTNVPPQTLEVLLATVFQKKATLSASSFKALLRPVQPGSLLVFRDEKGVPIHTAFQSKEGLLSKNGDFEPRIYRRLEFLKRVYKRTVVIECYQLEAEKVKAHLQHPGVLAEAR